VPVIIVGGAMILAGIGFWVWKAYYDLPRRFAAVERGVLYRSGQGDRYEFANAVRQHGIRTLICLRKPKNNENTDWLDAEKRAAENAGIRFVYWPMDSNRPLGEEYWLEFFRMTQQPNQTPILIHCALGRHRTGFFAGLYRMVINGWPLEKTLSEMERLGFDLNTHTVLVDTLKNLNVAELKTKLDRPATLPAE